MHCLLYFMHVLCFVLYTSFCSSDSDRDVVSRTCIFSPIFSTNKDLKLGREDVYHRYFLRVCEMKMILRTT